jgi:hypothetical protein
MENRRLKDTLGDLYELLDEIERERRDLSPENRRKITRAICQVLARERPGHTVGSADDGNGDRSPYVRVYAPR